MGCQSVSECSQQEYQTEAPFSTLEDHNVAHGQQSSLYMKGTRALGSFKLHVKLAGSQLEACEELFGNQEK